MTKIAHFVRPYGVRIKKEEEKEGRKERKEKLKREVGRYRCYYHILPLTIQQTITDWLNSDGEQGDVCHTAALNALLL